MNLDKVACVGAGKNSSGDVNFDEQRPVAFVTNVLEMLCVSLLQVV